MSVTYEQLLSLRADNVPYAFTERDSMLYALAVGMGRDPLDEDELRFVLEKAPLRTVPSQAVVVARQRLMPESGLTLNKMLHGEQVLTIHRPLPPAAELVADHWIVDAFDKGPGKGLIVQQESAIRLAGDGQPLFHIYNLMFARADGGIGSPRQNPPPPHPMPTRAPDVVRISRTYPEQALLYRLTNDRNMLHADPEVARAAGFKAPILHGSCTYGFACREIVASVCDYDDTRMRSFGTRFTSVVWPGETIETRIWVDGDVVSFRCRVVERDVVVLDHGKCVLGPPRPRAPSA